MDYRLRQLDWLFISLTLGVFLLPLKLSLAYIFFIPALLLWYWLVLKRQVPALGNARELCIPLYTLFVAALLCAPFGIDPVRSSVALLAALFMVALIPSISQTFQGRSMWLPLAVLFAAQTLAGIHSILDWLFPGKLSQMLVGQVTESGQLSLLLPALFGVLASLYQCQRTAPYLDLRRGGYTIRIGTFHTALWALVNLSILLGLCFARYAGLSPALFQICTLATCVIGTLPAILTWLGRQQRVNQERLIAFFLTTTTLPVLIVTLLINLKRGPWAGVILGTLLFLSCVKRSIILPLLILVALLFSSIEPLRMRLESSREHFFISGGRSEIWDIGAELVTTYPLGIGFENSPVLRDFSPSIPPELRHFHSNTINIAVEMGLIVLSLFLWWLVVVCKRSFRAQQTRSLTLFGYGIGCAFVSWQVAGLVEYNFGDSEVLFVAYVLLASLAGIGGERQADVSTFEKCSTLNRS